MAAPFDPAPYGALSKGSSSHGAAAGEQKDNAIVELSLEWRGLTYTLPGVKKQPPSVVLRNIHGIAQPREIFALMGASGSGKTSLLNALAGRLPVLPTGATIEGEVAVRMPGEPPVSALRVDMPSISAYVEQDDALFSLSTVEETFGMIAELRLPHVPNRKERVLNLIQELGLLPRKDTIVGSDRPGQRGLSGGERKRVNIGCELLHKPSILFVDEPTTGLDSFQAMYVMEALSALAKLGHTIILSIHQPRSSIYHSIGKVMLLSEGNAVYCGLGGQTCCDFFKAAGFPVPENFNPADHFLDTIGMDHRSEELLAASKKRVNDLMHTSLPDGAYHVGHEPLDSPGALPRYLIRGRQDKKAPFYVAFSLLLRRTWREVMRDLVALVVRSCMQLFFTLLFGFVYFQMGMSQKSLQNRTGLLFFMAMNQSFASVISVAGSIPRQLKVVQRERAGKLYSMPPFYISTMMTQLPIEILPSLLWGLILYHMVALRPGLNHFGFYIATLTAENVAGIGLGMLISASCTTVEMAPQVAPAFATMFIVFGGFLLNQDDIPTFFAPLKHISYVRYSFQALISNELKDNNDFSCKERVFGPHCLQGNDWLKQLGFEDVDPKRNIYIMLMEAVIFNILALLVLVIRKPAFLRMTKPSRSV